MKRSAARPPAAFLAVASLCLVCLTCLVGLVANATTCEAATTRAHAATRKPALTAAAATTRAHAKADLGVATSFLNRELAVYAAHYANGYWGDGEVGCWACTQGGPMTAAATDYVITGNKQMLARAVQTLNLAIATRQSSAGAFSDPVTGQSDQITSQSDQITTMFFGDEFGETYLLLNSHVAKATAASWRTALERTANYMINSGASTWYANGNVNLGIVELLWTTWLASGQRRYLNAANVAWSVLEQPNQLLFNGCGWFTVKTPSVRFDANGAGYFAETGAGGTGYDPYYSMLQLDVAARLYLISGDLRFLRAANMLMNQENPRVNKSSWMINVSNGTRHTAANSYQGFQTSAYAVLSLLSNRRDLTRDVLPELRTDERWFSQAGQPNSDVFRRAISTSVSTAALAALIGSSGWTAGHSLAHLR